MRFFKAFLWAFFFFVLPDAGRAQGLSLISDEETQEVLTSWLAPIFKAADLDVSRMEIHLVKDDSINAFAAKGLHVFIHTGLITKADNAQEVISVLAHETGHIAGGHIVRLYENMRIAQRNVLVSMLLATVAGAASGRGDVGMAAWAAGSVSAQNLLMGYRRTEENAADQSAVSYLLATGHDLTGFRDMMKKLEAQEKLTIDPNTDVLWRTHPEIKDRLAFILNQNKNVPPADKKKTAKENADFQRIRAKLHAFLYPPDRTLKKYPLSDKSLPARYARAIAAYRSGKFDSAVRQIDDLIKTYPDDAFFYELKGQILFETGQAKKAVSAYEKAVALRGKSVLLRIGYAQALIETQERENLLKAAETLEDVSASHARISFVWRLLAIAYGRLDRLDLAAYAQAENAFLSQDDASARLFADKALRLLPESSAAALRTQDILEQLKMRSLERKNLAH